MRPSHGKAIVGGFLGTILITFVHHAVGARLTGAPIDFGAALATLLGISWSAGMTVHFINGIVFFPTLYVFVVFASLPGQPWARGLMFGLLLWVLAEIVMMPLSGRGFFAALEGGWPAALVSLFAHTLYGISLGAIAGDAVVPERGQLRFGAPSEAHR